MATLSYSGKNGFNRHAVSTKLSPYFFILIILITACSHIKTGLNNNYHLSREEAIRTYKNWLKTYKPNYCADPGQLMIQQGNQGIEINDKTNNVRFSLYNMQSMEVHDGNGVTKQRLYENIPTKQIKLLEISELLKKSDALLRLSYNPDNYNRARYSYYNPSSLGLPDNEKGKEKGIPLLRVTYRRVIDGIEFDDRIIEFVIFQDDGSLYCIYVWDEPANLELLKTRLISRDQIKSKAIDLLKKQFNVLPGADIINHTIDKVTLMAESPEIKGEKDYHKLVFFYRFIITVDGVDQYSKKNVKYKCLVDVNAKTGKRNHAINWRMIN